MRAGPGGGTSGEAPSPTPFPEGEGVFSPLAARLAGQAGVLLGWPPETFWAATPAELGAVLSALAGGEADAAAGAADLARLREMYPDG